MFTLKPISRDSVDGALAKAERYRLLNEPHEAESICRDILEVDPANRQARISLVLALTDEIPHESGAFSSAMEAMSGLETEYDRTYYSGVAWERRARASYATGGGGSGGYVDDWTVRALQLFGAAEHLRPAGNDDAILRWNAGVRFLDRHKELRPKMEEAPEPILSEEYSEPPGTTPPRTSRCVYRRLFAAWRSLRIRPQCSLLGVQTKGCLLETGTQKCKRQPPARSTTYLRAESGADRARK